MNKVYIPEGYSSPLSVYDMQVAIERLANQTLQSALHSVTNYPRGANLIKENESLSPTASNSVRTGNQGEWRDDAILSESCKTE